MQSVKGSTRPGTTDYNSKAAVRRLQNIVMKQKSMFEKMQKSAYVIPNAVISDDSPASCDKPNNVFGLDGL